MPLEALDGASELRQNLLRVAALAREPDRAPPVRQGALGIASPLSNHCAVHASRRLEIVRRTGLALRDESSFSCERLVPATLDEIPGSALVAQPAHVGGVPEAFGDLQALGEELAGAAQLELEERGDRQVVGDRGRLRRVDRERDRERLVPILDPRVVAEVDLGVRRNRCAAGAQLDESSGEGVEQEVEVEKAGDFGLAQEEQVAALAQ